VELLSPPVDAAHVHNAAIASPYSNLEPVIASPRAVNKEPATAIYPPDIPEAPVPEQPFTLATTNPPTSIEIGADADGNISLGACLRGRQYRRQQQDKSKS
jgi:hypothetical protein